MASFCSWVTQVVLLRLRSRVTLTTFVPSRFVIALGVLPMNMFMVRTLGESRVPNLVVNLWEIHCSSPGVNIKLTHLGRRVPVVVTLLGWARLYNPTSATVASLTFVVP